MERVSSEMRDLSVENSKIPTESRFETQHKSYISDISITDADENHVRVAQTQS